MEVEPVSDRPVHDRLEELFAADAMGGLDDDGRHELRELLTWHDAHCPECARFRGIRGGGRVDGAGRSNRCHCRPAPRSGC